MKILVVDDNECFYFLYRRKLTTLLKPSLVFAKSFIEGQAKANSEVFDLILISESVINHDNVKDVERLIEQSSPPVAITMMGRSQLSKLNGSRPDYVPLVDKSINGDDFVEALCKISKGRPGFEAVTLEKEISGSATRN